MTAAGNIDYKQFPNFESGINPDTLKPSSSEFIIMAETATERKWHCESKCQSLLQH